jgi:putative MFS transporter
VLRFYVPESPLYLARSGRPEEARAVLARVARTNRRTVAIPPLVPERAVKPALSALFSIKLRRRSVALLSAWALVSVAYYGVFVYLPLKLAGAGFGFMRGQEFLIVLALVQLPGYALAAYGVERWGRKPTLIGFLLLSAIGCMLYSFGNTTVLVVGSTLLMSFALLGTWAGLYAFTPEVYPTGLRASGMGLAGAVARFGGLLAPTIVAPVMAAHFTLALAMLASFLVLGAVAILCVDVESRQRALE